MNGQTRIIEVDPGDVVIISTGQYWQRCVRQNKPSNLADSSRLPVRIMSSDIALRLELLNPVDKEASNV